MLRRLVCVGLLCCGISPAYALDWIIFGPDDRAQEIRHGGDKPVPGENCPVGSKVRALSIINDEQGQPDLDYRHYVPAVSGVRRFVEAPAVEAKAVPNPDGFYADLAASGEFSDNEFGQALRCRYITDEKLRDQKILEYAATLSPVQLAKLLELAQKYNIRLPLN